MNRITGHLLILVFAMFMITGCSDRKANENLNPDPSVSGQNNAGDFYGQQDVQDEENIDSATEQSDNTQPHNDITPVRINYYTADVQTDQLRMAVAMLGSQEVLTPRLVLSYIVDSLEDSSVILGVDDVTVIDDLCVISFDNSVKDISISDPELEEVILDACAQSIIDNFDDINRICLRILGEAYVTEGHSFAYDYIYMDE